MKPSHILITRPEPHASELSQRLGGTGLQTIILPVFRFLPGYPGVDFHATWPDSGRRLAIFCSTRAVEFGLRQLPAGFLDGVEIAAIGPATARDLEQAGWSPTIVPEAGFDSESLLSEEQLSGSPGAALIFTAPGGRRLLYETLLDRDWKVQFAHVYRKEAVAPPASASKAILASDGMISVWTSGDALRHVAEQLDSRAWARVCDGDFVVISERLAELAGAYAVGKVLIARGPQNVHIASAVRTLLKV